MALNGNAASSGAGVTANTLAKPTSSASIYWRGVLSGASNFVGLIGTSFNNVGGSPFQGYLLVANLNANSMQASWNSGGTANNVTAGITASNNIVSIAATFQQGGSTVLYINGKQVNSGSFGASAITYTSTSQMMFCSYTAVPTRPLFGLGLIGCCWNRVLSAQEMMAMHLAPYQFLNFQQDDIFATMIGIQTFASTQKHVGGVAG